MLSRDEITTRLKENPEISVLIIGAGINGVGVFRDLALNGVDVLVVDRADFCSGTSAASSRMIHGGIRYLENGEFRLVREAVSERNQLIESAPHYVKPLPTAIPIFSRFSGILNAPLKFLNLLQRPSERGAIVIKAGLMLYDAYTGKGAPVPRHSFLPRKRALQRFPQLNPAIRYAAIYYDASMRDAERIALEVMLDGMRANDRALALNYVSAEAADGETVRLRDELTQQAIEVRPKLVINATGPWIDFVNEAMGVETQFIGGTKGSHIVVNHPGLLEACNGHEFFFENQDGRIVLIYPLGGRVIIGTTDIKIDNPDHARTTEDEIEYFLRFTKIVFPNIDIEREQIVYNYSGVRPLPYSDGARPEQISRDHHNRIIEPSAAHDYPIFNLIGGKWTSFRAFSEEVATEALQRLGRAHGVSTEDMPIGGGQNYPHEEEAQEVWLAQLAQRSGLPRPRLETLFDRYGTRAVEFAEFIAQESDQPLKHRHDYSVREVQYIGRVERVVHLTDFVQRRSLLALTGRLSYGLLVELAQILGDVIPWSEQEQQAEVARTLAILADQHGVVLHRSQS